MLGQRFSVAAAVRDQHGLGESYHAVVAPDAVCFAESTAEVAAIVKACGRHKTPIIPFGAGTSLEGHVSAAFVQEILDRQLSQSSLSPLDRRLATQPATAARWGCVVGAGMMLVEYPELADLQQRFAPFISSSLNFPLRP